MGLADGASNAVKETSNLGGKLWKWGRNTAGLLALSTMFAVATGGVSLAMDPTLTAAAAEAAGSSVAATTGALNVGLGDMASMTVQGLQHNLSLAIQGLQHIPGVG